MTILVFWLLCSVVTLLSSVIANMKDVKHGLEMSVRAYDIICWYENFQVYPEKGPEGFYGCDGQAAFQKDHTLNSKMNKADTKKYFGKWMIEMSPMQKLSEEWGADCNKYLKEPDKESEPPSNKLRDTLDDDLGKPYPFRGFAYCLLNKLHLKYGDRAIKLVKEQKTNGKMDMKLVEYGMEIATRAFDAVCWYENLVNLPANPKGFLACDGKAERLMKQAKAWNADVDMTKRDFGRFLTEGGRLESLGEEYNTNCAKYLRLPDSEPTANEGDSLNDESLQPYPFQAFAYCLMHTLRRSYGKAAIARVENEKTQGKKDWRQTFLDRDNDYRSNHGVPAFKLHDFLNDAAQKAADKLAQTCTLKSSPDRRWKDGESPVGENMFSWSDGNADKAQISYLASASWYSEGKLYPFEEDADGESTFGKTGRFTQTVWKSSKFVGYGIAQNPECSRMKTFIVGWYYPAGNMQGEWEENVFPPIN